MNKPVALTIAGSDPSGGAGLQADLKTFAAHGVHGTSAVSVITAQNASRFEVFPVSGNIITAQIEAVFEEFDIQAIKIGMLASTGAVTAVIDALQRHNPDGCIPVVLDPVLRASNGGQALEEGGLAVLCEELIPLTTLIKPNLAEAAVLGEATPATSIEDMKRQAVDLLGLGSNGVLLSGGHLAGPEAVDILCTVTKNRAFSAKKLKNAEFHGTGCTLTSAITANLARGIELFEAVEQAKDYLSELLIIPAQRDRAGAPRSLDHLVVKVPRSD